MNKMFGCVPLNIEEDKNLVCIRDYIMKLKKNE